MNGYGKCPDCGLDISIDSKICPYCGKEFEAKNRKKPLSKGKNIKK